MEVITGSILRNMLLYAGAILTKEKDKVNSLNVFPVPDGDTGTNMSLTLNAALREVDKVESKQINSITAALARGSLMGARGTAALFLSQFFRRFAEGLAHGQTEPPDDSAMALHKSSQTTYRAVMKPVEGTMLTVGGMLLRLLRPLQKRRHLASSRPEAAYEAAAKAVQTVRSSYPGLERSWSRGCRWSGPALYF